MVSCSHFINESVESVVSYFPVQLVHPQSCATSCNGASYRSWIYWDRIYTAGGKMCWNKHHHKFLFLFCWSWWSSFVTILAFTLLFYCHKIYLKQPMLKCLFIVKLCLMLSFSISNSSNHGSQQGAKWNSIAACCRTRSPAYRCYCQGWYFYPIPSLLWFFEFALEHRWAGCTCW